LYRKRGVLQAQADTGPQDDLVAVKVCFGCTVLDRVEETRGEGDEARSDDEEGFESADSRDKAGREDEEEDLNEDHREKSDTGARSGGVIDGLVTLGDVVDDESEDGEDGEGGYG